jgi:hypothetical protein
MRRALLVCWLRRWPGIPRLQIVDIRSRRTVRFRHVEALVKFAIGVHPAWRHRTMLLVGEVDQLLDAYQRRLHARDAGRSG